MITSLPEEVLLNIVKMNSGLSEGYHTYIEIDIREILKLRNVNKYFREIVDNINNLWDFENNMKGLPEIYYNRVFKNRVLKWNDYKYNTCLSIDEQMSELCKKGVSKESIKWLFKNNIFLSLKNIKDLIINNRKDILELSLNYKKNRDVIFNRFHFAQVTDNRDDILSCKECLHPLIVAGDNGKVDIIELLLRVNRNFIIELPTLLDCSIKYNHENLLTYLVVNHYTVLSEQLQNKLSQIINRVDKCQGIIFYLMNKRIFVITQKVLTGCISKNYTELFIYCYNRASSVINGIDLISSCIHYSNVEILNFLIGQKKIIISPEKFSFYFNRKRTYTKDFISNIVNYHKGYIKEKSNLIYLSIKYEIHNLLVKNLIFHNYHFNNDDITLAVNMDNYDLVEYMCQKKLNKIK